MEKLTNYGLDFELTLLRYVNKILIKITSI